MKLPSPNSKQSHLSCKLTIVNTETSSPLDVFGINIHVLQSSSFHPSTRILKCFLQTSFLILAKAAAPSECSTYATN
uniref:Uncharacterized protein n=1 Tax=Setaria italica TaxID=4555 RepID=K4AHI9_SETIT